MEKNKDNESQFVEHYSSDNESQFVEHYSSDNESQFVEHYSSNNESKFIEDSQFYQFTEFMSKLSNSINISINQNIPVEWNSVISYLQQLELMAEAIKNNDCDTLNNLSKQEINIHIDYHTENEKMFL